MLWPVHSEARLKYCREAAVPLPPNASWSAQFPPDLRECTPYQLPLEVSMTENSQRGSPPGSISRRRALASSLIGLFLASMPGLASVVSEPVRTFRRYRKIPKRVALYQFLWGGKLAATAITSSRQIDVRSSGAGSWILGGAVSGRRISMAIVVAQGTWEATKR
jgi:hypothetical protein